MTSAGLAALVTSGCGFFTNPADMSIAESRIVDVRAYLDRAARESGFSGVVLIGRGDTIILEEAYGPAEAEQEVPMRTDHLFRIGSLTKPVTASAVMAAVDDGHLSLDAAVCPLLSSCPRAWQDVRIRHLLTHTSGIRDHFGDLDAVPVDETVEELRRVLESLPADEPLRSPAGTEYSYSNFNYVLLGAALEHVMGAPWQSVLRQLVFEPLQLMSMQYDDVYAIVPGRVRGYEWDETMGLRNVEYDDHAAYAAGGLLSTARDVFRWSRGMLSGRLYSSSLVEESVTPYRGNYGYGWQIRRFFDRRIYNHTGGIDGFSSHLAHYPDDALTIVVLSNVENDPAILRACDIAARLFGWPATAFTGTEPTPQQRCGVEPT